jgi:hypothetical protein
MSYKTTIQKAIEWGVTRGRVHQLLVAGKIPGAMRVGRDWLIPEDAPYPMLKRRRRKPRVDTDEAVFKSLDEFGYGLDMVDDGIQRTGEEP